MFSKSIVVDYTLIFLRDLVIFKASSTRDNMHTKGKVVVEASNDNKEDNLA